MSLDIYILPWFEKNSVTTGRWLRSIWKDALKLIDEINWDITHAKTIHRL